MSDIVALVSEAGLQTIEMVLPALAISTVLGLVMGAWLAVTSPQGIAPSPRAHQALAGIVNVSRSLPFLILIILLLPLTRIIAGTSIGTAAAIVPLAIGGIPYAARLAEAALLDIDPGLIQAAVTMGTTPAQAVLKIYVPETFPGLIRALTVLAITQVNFSAMAGAVGGGGLGDLAIRYGYQRFRIDILLACCLVLVVLVQAMQWMGTRLALYFTRQ